MIKTYLRPMTEGERNTLAERLLQLTNQPIPMTDRLGKTVWNGIRYAILALACLAWVAAARSWCGVPGLWLVGVIVLIVLASAIPNFERAAENEGRRKEYAGLLAQRLVRGEMEVTEVTASDVIEIDTGDEDVEPGFLFDIGNRQALYLSSDHFWLEAEEEVVPCSAFEMICYPDVSGDILSIERKGSALSVSRTLYWTDSKEAWAMTEGEIIDNVSLATIEQDRPDLFVVRAEDASDL